MRAVFILFISIRSACSNEIHFDMLFPREMKLLIDIAANYHYFVNVSDAMCPFSNRNCQFRSKNGRFVRSVGLDWCSPSYRCHGGWMLDWIRISIFAPVSEEFNKYWKFMSTSAFLHTYRKNVPKNCQSVYLPASVVQRILESTRCFMLCVSFLCMMSIWWSPIVTFSFVSNRCWFLSSLSFSFIVKIYVQCRYTTDSILLW